MANGLKVAFESGEFVVASEIIIGPGANEPRQTKEYAAAKEIYETGRLHVFSVADCPGGTPALMADTIAKEFLDDGIAPMVNFSCKDRGRNQLHSQLYALQRQGIQNVLVMSGDYQRGGWNGKTRPVFDLDPVQTLLLISDMNKGLISQTPKGQVTEQPTDFYAGAGVNPYKYTEGETIPQYLQLERKILAGAKYIIAQLGYDSRKLQEFKFYLEERGYDIPLVANVFLLSPIAARQMYKGAVAGCYVPERLLTLLEEEAKADDKGLAAKIERAAKMVAIAKGLGFNGICFGGFGVTVEIINKVLDRAAELADDWRALAAEISYGDPSGFYLYQPELDQSGVPTGLNTCEHSVRNEKAKGRKIFAGYGLSRFLHYWVMTPGKRLYNLLASSMDRRERKKGLSRRHVLEHLSKTAIYGCMDCGDCGLEASIYSCPMSQCPKSERNGPCGGSADGWCELYLGQRYCIYYKAYHRLKKYDELYKMSSFITLPNDWELYETSAWSNYTHKRDNTAKRIPVQIGLDGD
jgi:methylenetetrahydrofolate reductase (NADPH)